MSIGIVLLFSIFIGCAKLEKPTNPSTTTQQTTTTTEPANIVEEVDLNNYVGYWYNCWIVDRDNRDEQFFVDVNQLHIKSVENNVITLDYTLTTMIDEKDVVVEVKDNICEFQADGCKVNIAFAEDDYGDAFIGVSADDGDVSVGSTLSLHSSTKPVEAEFKVTPADNYDFENYLGYWYMEKPEIPDGAYLISDFEEIHIKKVEGNVVTFDYILVEQGPVSDNDIVVEINNNVGLFKGKKTFGILKFTEDSLVIDARTLYGGGTIIEEEVFEYQTSTDWNQKLEEDKALKGYS